MGVPVSIGGAYFHIFGKRAKPEQAIPRLRAYGVTVPEDYLKRADNIDSDQVNRAKERFDAEEAARVEAERLLAEGPVNRYGPLREKIEKAIHEVGAEASAEPRLTAPDFVLANYLIACLVAFDAAVTARDAWDARELVASPPNEELPL